MPAFSTAANLLVASLRIWALPYRHPAPDYPDWRGGFVAAGIDAVATPAFGAILTILTRAARRPLDVRCPHAHFLGEDEARFLGMIALYQRDRLDEPRTILDAWLPPAAARMAAMPALGLAFAMKRGGLELPIRFATPPRAVPRFASVH